MSNTAPPEILNKAAHKEAPLPNTTNRPTLPFESCLSEGVMKRRCRLASRAFRDAGALARQACRGLPGKLLRLGTVALGMALMPVAAHANGTMVDMFTYTGNQLGSSASGNVYAMSIAGTDLNTCLFTPVSGQSQPNVEYTPSCQNTLAPAPLNSNSYTAVAFLGVPNNPNNYFAVGDSGGNIYLMQMTFTLGNPNPTRVRVQQTYSLASPDNANNSCGQIASLALDPNGSYLYVSCVQSKNSIYWRASNSTSYGALYGVTLAVYSINSDGTLSFVRNVASSVPSGNSGYWAQAVTSNAASSAVTAAAFPSNPNRGVTNVATAVNPKLRVYPPGYPALASTGYASSGAVFLSGILSGFSGDVPINSGFLCSAGSCQVAYNMAFSQNYGGWVFTAAEYGTTYSPNNNPGAPVLYWNQVQAGVSTDGINIYNNVSNALQTCLLNSVITSTLTTQANTCATTNTVTWPPITNIPSSTIWIDQLAFSPTPAGALNETSFTQGLLQISAWNNGYLAYYDVAANTFKSGLFMANNGSNGEVGANVQGITTDANGNMLIQAGSSGLLGFNAFPTSSTNIETQSDVTYVPIPADTNANNTCGTSCRVKQAFRFAKFMVTTVITTGASLEDDGSSNRTQFAINTPFSGDEWPDANKSEDNDVVQLALNTLGGMRNDMTGLTATDADTSLFDLAAMEVAASSAVTPYPDAPSPVLANFLGAKPYWGRFTYSEDQMRLMGLTPGSVITGMQLRLADGISAQPQLPIRFNRMQIGLATGGSADVNQPASRFGANVFNRSLSIARCSYNRSVRDGYGPVIKFKKPYRYRGGKLTITLRHSGSLNSKRFYLNAIGGASVSGAYSQIRSVSSKPTTITMLKVAPDIKFIKRGEVVQDANAPARCD